MPTLAGKNQWSVEIIAATASGSASFQETSAVIGDTLHADFTWQDAIINGAGSSAYYCAMAIINPDNHKPAYYREYDDPDGSHLLEWVADMVGTWTAQIDIWDGTGWITYMEPITVSPVSDGICSWIENKGGPSALVLTDVTDVIQSFVYGTSLFEEYVAVLSDASGTVQYWLGFIENGDAITGCQFYSGV